MIVIKGLPLTYVIIIGLSRNDDIIPVDSEKFLVTHMEQYSLAHTDELSIISYDTYTKDKPQVQDTYYDATSDTEHDYKDPSMYPEMSNTDDDDIDDDVDDYASRTQCVSNDYPSTFPQSSYQQQQQHTSGKINCCHPTKYSRKH